MKIPLFFNNTARSARAGRFRRWLDRHRDFFDVIEPESREDMLNHLVSQANSGAPAVAVAGGDGTLGIAARALCNTETVLAPFPAGTMNVFSREIGIRPDFDHALHILNTGRSKNVALESWRYSMTWKFSMDLVNFRFSFSRFKIFIGTFLSFIKKKNSDPSCFFYYTGKKAKSTEKFRKKGNLEIMLSIFQRSDKIKFRKRKQYGQRRKI